MFTPSHVKNNAEDEEAFDVLYCIAFEMMDAQWLAMHASYMEFNVLSCDPNSKFLVKFTDTDFIRNFRWLFLGSNSAGCSDCNKNTIGKGAGFRWYSADTRSTSLQPVVPVAWFSAHPHEYINFNLLTEGGPSQPTLRELCKSWIRSRKKFLVQGFERHLSTIF